MTANATHDGKRDESKAERPEETRPEEARWIVLENCDSPAHGARRARVIARQIDPMFRGQIRVSQVVSWCVEVSPDVYEMLAVRSAETVFERSCRACGQKRTIRALTAAETSRCTACGSKATDDAGPYGVPEPACDAVERLVG